MKEHEKGAEFTASEEEVEERIEDVAEEVGQSAEKVRENVESMLNASDDAVDGGVSTSFNESVSGESLNHDEVGEGDPRLEALELYRLRQKI